MSLNAEVQNINAEALKYTPSVVQTVLAVEQAAAGLPGQNKNEIAVNCILAGSQAVMTTVPNQTVQGLAALVSLIVSVLNLTGIFKKKAK